MLKIALTGGIATGKSHVLEGLRRRGVPCLDADALAHGVEAAGTEATRAIAARFGDGVLARDGSVDRTKLGPIVFADSAARSDLEAIVHPAVYRAIRAGLRAFELTGNPQLAVVDVPLLFESGRASDFDSVIATVCKPDIQLTRLMARGMNEEAARQRLAAQLPAAEKATRASHVIDTSGTFEETDAQVDKILYALGFFPSK
jgi:dephospho-CoA kinase